MVQRSTSRLPLFTALILAWDVLSAQSPIGGEPTQLPYGIADPIAHGLNGALVLGRNIAEPAYWKRYRGGPAGYFWIDPDGGGNFAVSSICPGTCPAPCFAGDRFYFISDDWGIGNVYSCLIDGNDLRRHSSHEDFYAHNLQRMAAAVFTTREATFISSIRSPDDSVGADRC